MTPTTRDPRPAAAPTAAPGTRIFHVHAEVYADVSQVPLARAVAEQALDDWGLGVHADIVALGVSELVTNAIVHTHPTIQPAPRISLELRYDPAHTDLWVGVTDTDPTLPKKRDPDLYRTGGRGILIVDRLSTDWGVDPCPPGKTVWFRIDVAAPLPA